ncbi:hypothetical protein D3C81_2030170 [compost metagenome]
MFYRHTGLVPQGPQHQEYNHLSKGKRNNLRQRRIQDGPQPAFEDRCQTVEVQSAHDAEQQYNQSIEENDQREKNLRQPENNFGPFPNGIQRNEYKKQHRDGHRSVLQHG